MKISKMLQFRSTLCTKLTGRCFGLGLMKLGSWLPDWVATFLASWAGRDGSAGGFSKYPPTVPGADLEPQGIVLVQCEECRGRVVSLFAPCAARGGRVVASTVSAKCSARQLEGVAMPRTRPSGLREAVQRVRPRFHVWPRVAHA